MAHKFLLKLTTHILTILTINSCALQENNKKLSIVPLLSPFPTTFTQGWHYQANTYAKSDENFDNNLKNKTVLVTEFEDLRGNYSKNRNALLAVPLFPYGYIDYDRPEDNDGYVSGLERGYHAKFNVLMSNALVDELENANIFKKINTYHIPEKSDYYIKGSIISSKYSGKTLSYGLGGVGVLLWFVGLPAIYFSNDLEIELSLINYKTQKIVFQKRYKKEFSRLDWLYYIHNDIRYDQMLEELYKDFVEDLRSNKLN